MTPRTSRLVSTLSLAAIIGVGGLVFNLSAQPTADRPAQPERRPGGPGQGGPGGREGGPEGRGGLSVDGAMKGMNRAARQLGGQIGDAAKKDENLKLIGDMQRGAINAKNLPVPAELLAKAKDEAEKAKLAATFRSNLIKLTRALLDLEELVIDGKSTEAKTKFDEIVKMKDAGHDAMGMK